MVTTLKQLTKLWSSLYGENFRENYSALYRALKNPVKKLYCVAFLGREDWDCPTIVHVLASDEDTALKKAVKKISFTKREVEEMVDNGSYSVEIQEVAT